MVGSHCAEYFSKKKWKVIALDNLMRSRIFGSRERSVEYNWRYLKGLSSIRCILQDVRDIHAVKRIFQREKPDVVVHAAGQPGVRFSLENPQEDFSINAFGTFNILEAFSKVNSRGTFVYCSTNKVYGDNVNQIKLCKTQLRYHFSASSGVSEQMCIDRTGHTPYGVSKLAGDLYVQDFGHTYHLRTGVFRMSCIYGTRQFGFEDQGWVAWFAIRFFQGLPLVIYGDGKQVRDVLWVGDLIQAYERFITGRMESNVFNIGGGTSCTLSLLELIALLEKMTRKTVRISFKPWRPFDQKVYISDIRKVQRILGWKPSVSPQQGVSRLFGWIQSNRALFSK